jgi:hypothetical protein
MIDKGDLMMNLAQGSARRPRGSHRKVMVFSAAIIGALVLTLLIRPHAHALSVFCVGAKWGDGNGGTMAGSGYPSPVSSKLRDDVWRRGASGETIAVKGDLESRRNRVFYPQIHGQRMCPVDAAAPCVITDTVTITSSTWKVQKWNVEGRAGGTLFGITVGVSGGYGEEYGKSEAESYTLSNMVPYGIGATATPASFIDWKTRSGVIRGGYFKTGAACRVDGASGMQYEFRDEELGSWTAEENHGSGGTWLIEGPPKETKETRNHPPRRPSPPRVQHDSQTSAMPPLAR